MTPAEFVRRIRRKKSKKDVFLFFPWKSYAQDDVLAGDIGDLRAAGVQFTVLKKSWRCMSRVNDEALIMIAGHGGEGSDSISMEGPRGEKSLTADDLAELLDKLGLAKTHQSILLLTCYGGGAMEDRASTAPRIVGTGSYTVRSNSNGQCLASILAKAMGLRGYRSILVGGWPGSFVSNDFEVNGPSFLGDGDEGTEDVISANIDQIQWFDAKGNNTAG